MSDLKHAYEERRSPVLSENKAPTPPNPSGRTFPSLPSHLVLPMIAILCVIGMASLLFMTQGGLEKRNASAQSGGLFEDHSLPLATGQPMAKILLVHSYQPGYPWVEAITEGVKRAIVGHEVDLEIFYMDTKRRVNEEWKTAAGEKARQIVEEWRPDVVIAADDNAQQYFARNYVGAESPLIVFCGVNAKPEKYGYPANNVTGILERPHFSLSLEQLRKVVPSAERIAIVTDDSPTSRSALGFMQDPPPPFEVVSCRKADTFGKWQQAIMECQETADAIAIYMYHTIRRGDEIESMPPKEVMSWTFKQSRIPVIGFFIFAVDDGALCGYLESGVEHGFRAGRMSIALLKGESPSDIPVVTALKGHSMLNLVTARKLGIQVPTEIVQETEIVIEDKQ